MLVAKWLLASLGESIPVVLRRPSLRLPLQAVEAPVINDFSMLASSTDCLADPADHVLFVGVNTHGRATVVVGPGASKRARPRRDTHKNLGSGRCGCVSG